MMAFRLYLDYLIPYFYFLFFFFVAFFFVFLSTCPS